MPSDPRRQTLTSQGKKRPGCGRVGFGNLRSTVGGFLQSLCPVAVGPSLLVRASGTDAVSYGKTVERGLEGVSFQAYVKMREA